jgi:hypothetical protein
VNRLLWFWGKHKQLLLTDADTGKVYACDGVEIKNLREITDRKKLTKFRNFQGMGQVQPAGSVIILEDVINQKEVDPKCQ